MIIPAKLSPGDAVAIVGLARKVSPEEIRPAFEILENWGLAPVLAPHLFSNTHPYLSGSDHERRADLQGFIDDKKIKAIFAARGGYGCTRIIDAIDFSALQSAPKWIIGFSDVTAVHLALSVEGVASIHGTMPIFFGPEKAETSVESLKRILFAEGAVDISFSSANSNRAGNAAGPLIGGNLSLIADAMGTAAEPDTSGKILVVEEVDEYHYKIDRMFTQLRRSGKLKNLAGLVVGHMTDIKDSTLPFGNTVQEIVMNAVRDYSFPVAFDFPSGHEDPNIAWIHGSAALLEVADHSASLRQIGPPANSTM